MLTQLPIRLSFFIRCIWNVVLAYLAGIGALAIYNGYADIISWYVLGAFVVGSVLYQVPWALTQHGGFPKRL